MSLLKTIETTHNISIC